VDLPLNGSAQPHISIDVELADQAVARTERDAATVAGGR
jgi:hypothetical protein